MANQVDNGDFEDGVLAPWVAIDQAGLASSNPYEGSWHGYVGAYKGFGPTEAGQLYVDFVPDPLVEYPHRFRVSKSSSNEKDLLVYVFEDGSPVLWQTITDAEVPIYPDYLEVVLGAHAYDAGAVGRIMFWVLPRSTDGTDRYWIDLVEVYSRGSEDLMARSHMSTFLSNLKTEIEAIDPNIGEVFLAEKRWSSEEDLVDDDAVVAINTAGLFDSNEDLGKNALRFWILEPWIEPRPLTVGSYEYRGRVQIIGFYGQKEETAQAVDLRDAAIEIVDQVALKTTELGSLALSMGDGYMGFLNSPPRMLGPARGARLVAGATGHVIRIQVDYFEEVTR